MNARTYLDHAATTPVDLRVVEAMLPYWTEYWGNPSSIYQEAQEARKGLDTARRTIAEVLSAKPQEIIFAGGGSEADNLAVRGAAMAARRRGDHIITSQIEHHAVLHTVQQLERDGFQATYLPVDGEGFVDLDALERAVTDRTTVVSIMLANNEVGTIQPIAEIAKVVRGRKGVLLHVDAVQAAPYLDLDVAALDADLVSLGAHKFEGPKGAGALYVRHGTHILAQQQGGEQERHRRAGTENVAGAVGLAAAYELSCTERSETVGRLRRQRDRLAKAILATPGTETTGHPRQRLPGLLSIIARDTDGVSVSMSLDLEGIACSVGSACTTGSTEVSHVLTAMGYPEEEARGALRLSLGRTTTDDEIDTAAEVVPRVLASMRLGTVAVAADPLGQRVGV
jgi:cysteine desulfurase